VQSAGKREPFPLIRLRGAPKSLRGHWPVRTPSALVPLVEFEAAEKLSLKETPRLTLTPHPTGTDLFLKLPAHTPPGSYRAAFAAEGSSHEITIEIQSTPALEVFPSTLQIEGKPGARVVDQITVANVGNVRAVIAERYAVGLYNNEGVERAIFKTFTAKLAEGKGRADRFLDELAAQHGGLVPISIGSGSGALAVGESRVLDLTFDLRSRVKANERYFGSFPLWGASRLAVQLQVFESGGPS
jgi:hypothetical protein